VKTAAVVPAQPHHDEHGRVFSPEFGDTYHPLVGALPQARHVFVAGNGLPQRWRGRERFVALETGFGLGNNFLAFWDAWRADPERSRELFFISIEAHPFVAADLARLHAASPLPDLASALLAAWPPLTPGMHRLSFEGGRVHLLLAFGDVNAWLPEIVAEVDAFVLDGFAPARNPQMWRPALFKAMARLAAPAATVATWSAARPLRDGLAAAGFAVRSAAGIGGKREITLADFAPGFVPRRALVRRPPVRTASREALIVGAGLAGCAAAWALAERGWNSLLLERHEGIARETSGNPAGLFHGVVHLGDGVHARFNRAAALQATTAVRHAIDAHGVAGSVQGLLRLDFGAGALDAMRALAVAQRLPEGYARAVDASEASHRASVALGAPAWFYAGGGWVDPAGLARSYLQRAAGGVRLVPGKRVHALRSVGDTWQALDEDGVVLGQAPHVVVANAADAARLIGQAWPLQSVRGQLSTALLTPSVPRPLLPISGAGYVLAHGDAMSFGATADADDADPAVRAGDHERNLAQLQRLSAEFAGASALQWSGRVGWRVVAADRLPLAGRVPLPHRPGAEGVDQVRHMARIDGLHVLGALASRGIGWSALAGQIVASSITGAPAPLEASLLDAVDPGRFAVRAVRRAGR
jgi:tRNA 5-methylaminomethyl-2-thiouridine biosynthesis bifunctional protein